MNIERAVVKLKQEINEIIREQEKELLSFHADHVDLESEEVFDGEKLLKDYDFAYRDLKKYASDNFQHWSNSD